MTTASSFRLISLALASLVVTGCTSRMVPSGTPIAAHLQGGVHGGLQPVSGSTMQLYDADLGGQPLISATVLSDVNGNFNITGDYTCPSNTDQVYLAGTGGNPGAGENDSLVLMTAMGPCGNLSAASYVNVNEVSTVATLAAYSSYINPGVSAPGGYINGDDPDSYTKFLTLVDPATGNALANSDPLSPMKLNSLANSLSICINATTVGGVAQPCVDLINLSGPSFGATFPQNSASASFFFVVWSNYNPVGVFDEASAAPPYQPALTTAPSDWSLWVH